jgi:hypothetical protein
MSLQDFVRKSGDRYREQGPSVLLSIGVDFLMSALAKTPVLPRFGTNVFEREWDVLLILDAARLDMYRRILDPAAGSIWSVGSSSDEWMRHTFQPKYSTALAETAYVTGNPFSETECPTRAFGAVDELWCDHWDEEAGTIGPQPITDRVIDRHRQGFDRVVGHYMQPHYPFIGERTADDGKMTWDVVGNEAQQGEGLALWDQFLSGVRDDLDEVWRAYDDNLRHVQSHVKTVCENADGQVVVTADHGNALGEWGMWGHKPGMPHPKMRRVPWDIYECTDRKTYTPDLEETDNEINRQDQIESLGYL